MELLYKRSLGHISFVATIQNGRHELLVVVSTAELNLEEVNTFRNT